MNTTAKLLIGACVLYLLGRSVSRPSLQFFRASEFGPWWPLMNADLLRRLDAFRSAWGFPVEVSTAAGSLGRHGGDAGSLHNVDRWGEIRAADVFPKVPDGAGGYRYMTSAADRLRAFQVAQAVGFTGIGLYTDTKPGNLLHVDNRPAERVATWSRVNGGYQGIDAVLA